MSYGKIRRGLIALAVVLIAGNLLAASEPPPPTPLELSHPVQKKTTSAHKKPQPDQRGTEQAPLIVKTINPPKGEEELKAEQAEREEKAASDGKLISYTGWLVWFTGFLAIFTFVLGVATIALFRATKIAALAAKKAAEVAEKALFDLERPHIFIEIVHPGITMNPGGGLTFAVEWFTYNFVNYGRTPAELIELHYEFPVIAKPTFVSPLDSSKPGMLLPRGIFIGAEKPYKMTENIFAKAMKDGDVTKLLEPYAWKDHQLFFIGYARYRDIFDNKYVLGFCAYYDAISKGFVFQGDERYNYTKKEEQPPHLFSPVGVLAT